MLLEGKNAVVYGAGGVIGGAVARGLSRRSEKRLFEDGLDTASPKLVETKTFGSGVVALTYRPAENGAEGAMETR